MVVFLSSVDLFQGGVLLDQMKVELSSNWDLVQIPNLFNGLVCFKRYAGKVVIHKPNTGDKTSWIESRVPWEEKHMTKETFYGFGFDPKTKEHKVVCLWLSDDPRYETGASDFCEVLTVGQNTWRRINDVPPYKAYGESVYVNGVVYCLSTYRKHYDVSTSADAKFIVAFDIGREKFRVITIPDFITDCRQSGGRFDNSNDLLVIDGCVGLLDRRVIVDGDNKNVIKMWIFHDDHTTSNWTEETISIPLEWEQKWSLYNRKYTMHGSFVSSHFRYEHDHYDVLSLYCHDRKKKTMDFVKINIVSNGKSFPEDEAINGFKCGTLVESLYPVLIMEPNQISALNNSESNFYGCFITGYASIFITA